MNFFHSALANKLIKVYLGRRESYLRYLNDGLLQESVLAPLLFNVYLAEIPVTKLKLLMDLVA